MNYTNSPLVTYTRLSPNCNARQSDRYNPSGAITKITLHHTACNASLQALGNGFANPARQASSNYGIDSNGNVGMFVEEKNRAWTSSSAANDHLAVTVEISNDRGEPDWHVSDKALNAAINLCVDICKRNGIKKLNYTGNTSGNLTMHCWFAATGCPGPYLKSKFQYIADQVNAKLEAKPTPTPKPTPTQKFAKGDRVKMSKNAVVYGTAQKFKPYIYDSILYVRDMDDACKRIVVSTVPEGDITGAVDAKYLTKVSVNPTPAPQPKLPGYTGIITYQAYSGGKWWSEISSANANGTGYNSYAGVIGTPINALKAKAQYGKLWISVHYLGGGWSKKYDMSNGASAGTTTKKIDAVKIWSETGHVDFQVHAGGKWWSWIDSRNCDKSDYNSYAGLIGTPIDAIKMK